ncbi:MAG: flagellar filament capping protein FliD [Synergistaceae bacterium]|nr:flagellar filament capping protein FliD [Synergistaceae bacterium]
MPSMSINGVVSGMDWESMIDEIITSAAKPAQVQVAKRTDLKNKKTLFEEMKVMVQSIQSSLSTLKLPSTYKAKDIEIERTEGTGSYKKILTATVNADAQVNVYDLEVKQIATAQTNRTKQITGSTIASALSSGGVTNPGKIFINAGGQKIGIDVRSTDSLQSLKSRINNTISTLDNSVNLTASVVDSRLIIRSNNTGLGVTSASETLRYTGSPVSTLQNLANDGSGNFSVSSNGTVYTRGTDYVIANGNQIRWKQSDTGPEVELGGSMDVKYTMAAGDVYSASGTYGSSEAQISGFTITDGGTLGSRVKITDSDGNTYAYGEDFTLKNGRVVWNEEEADTAEPSTYTVKYSKETDETYDVAGVKTDLPPASYTVSYKRELASLTAGSFSAASGNTNAATVSSMNFSQMSALEGASAIDASPTGIQYVTFADGYEPSLTIDGTEYVYGRDYVFSKSTDGTLILSNASDTYTDSDGNTHSYVEDYQNKTGKTFSGEVLNPVTDIASASFSLTNSVTENNGITDTGTISDIIITSGGKTYVEGEEYTIETDGSGNKSIAWNTAADPVDLTDAQFEELAENYAKAYKAEHGTTATLTTKTLLDGDNVIRTYIDPSDPSLLTMTDADGKSYEYGRDYVLRVRDSGSGYHVEWLNDTNTIANANKIVTAYTADKGISTLGWQKAPSDGKSFTFGLSYTLKETKSATVHSSDEDKSLSSILSGITVDPYDYDDEDILSISSGSKTYEYGEDYTITDDGKIEWIRTKPAKPSSDVTFQISYNDDGGSGASASNLTLSNTAGQSVTTLLGSVYSNPSTLVITDSTGKTYEYDTDFILNSDGTLYWLADDLSSRPASGSTYTLTYEAFSALEMNGTYSPAPATQNLFLYVDEGSGNFGGDMLSWEQILNDRSIKSTASQEDIDSKLASSFTLSDGGKTYEYGTDYRIVQGDNVDADSEEHNAVIEWIGGGDHPSANFTLTYTGRGKEGSEVINTTITRSVSDTINPDTSSVASINAVLRAATEVRITNANESETYLMGSDFTIDDNGSVRWLSGGGRAANYSTAFDGARSITVTDSNGDAVTGFTIDANNDGNARFAMEDGSTLAAGTYTIKVVKNNKTTLYNLTSDGTTASITTRSLWESQDNTNAASYNVYVTSPENGTQKFAGTRAAGSYGFTITSGATYPTKSEMELGSTTITQGAKTFFEGIDYDLGEDEDDRATIEWRTGEDALSEWFYPTPGSTYTINFTAANGSEATYTATRNATDVLDMKKLGMTKADGNLSVSYGDGLSIKWDTDAASDGFDGRARIRGTYSVDITKGTKFYEDGTADVFNFRWMVPTQTSRTNLPSYGDEVTVEYEYTQNTFTLTDDSDGKILAALGLSDEENITEAHNAILSIDGETDIERDSNDIGEAYGNELLKGVTLHLKNVGSVSIDIFQDAEKAVEAINTFTDNYNSLMQWMNTRMTESEVDKDTAATVDSDDFRMRWGLLHGNSLLRQTKSQMRDLMAQSFTFAFTQRTGNEEVYGTMATNGLINDATLRLRIAGTYMDLSILPSYTLQDVVDMINDKDNPEMHSNFYDETGRERESPLLKASIENDKLVLSSTGDETITMSGTAAMNALKVNYTYRGLFQVGLATTSTDYGKSGELEFDESKFMDALEDNADEVQELMLMFANQMDSWTKSMINTSASGETKGTLSRQIDDLDTRIASIDEYLEKYQDRLDRQEEALRKQYAAAEQNIAKLSQQASSIASILSMMNNSSSNNSSSSSSS